MTDVIFRFHEPSQTVSAVFPYLLFDLKGNVTCYERIGQHGAANYSKWIRATRPATHEEYEPLLRELERVGYDDLRIIKKINTAKYMKARNKLT